MKYRYIFLLGRAACGKSSLYCELEARLLQSGQAQSFERVDDFPKLWARFTDDDARDARGLDRRWSERTADGGYMVTAPNFLNELLEEVNADLLQIDKPGHIVFVEFARPSYVQAIQSFDQRILDHSLAIYIQVSFETCWARNVARHEGAIGGGGDDHMVGREAMEELFLHDDQDAFVEHMVEQGVPIMVVDNEPNGEQHLRQQVETLIEEFF